MEQYSLCFTSCIFLFDMFIQVAGPYSSDGRDCENGEHQKSDSITAVGTWRVSKNSWRRKGWCSFSGNPSFTQTVSQSSACHAVIQIQVTKSLCLYLPPCREEREEEEQQKLKEQHDIPASSLQSPGKTVGQVKDVHKFAT